MDVNLREIRVRCTGKSTSRTDISKKELTTKALYKVSKRGSEKGSSCIEFLRKSGRKIRLVFNPFNGFWAAKWLRTYTLFRHLFWLPFIDSVTGRQNPRHARMFHAGASAKGGIGISSTFTQRSRPLPSATHCRAAIAACRDVNVTTAYVEFWTTLLTIFPDLEAAHFRTLEVRWILAWLLRRTKFFTEPPKCHFPEFSRRCFEEVLLFCLCRLSSAIWVANCHWRSVPELELRCLRMTLLSAGMLLLSKSICPSSSSLWFRKFSSSFNIWSSRDRWLETKLPKESSSSCSISILLTLARASIKQMFASRTSSSASSSSSRSVFKSASLSSDVSHPYGQQPAELKKGAPKFVG